MNWFGLVVLIYGTVGMTLWIAFVADEAPASAEDGYNIAALAVPLWPLLLALGALDEFLSRREARKKRRAPVIREPIDPDQHLNNYMQNGVVTSTDVLKQEAM